MSTDRLCLRTLSNAEAKKKWSDYASTPLSTTDVLTVEVFLYLETATAGDTFVLVKQNASPYGTQFSVVLNTATQWVIRYEENDGTARSRYINFADVGTTTGKWMHIGLYYDAAATGAEFVIFFGEPDDAWGSYTLKTYAKNAGTGMTAWKSGSAKTMIGIGSDAGGGNNSDSRIVELRTWSDKRSSSELVTYNYTWLPESDPGGGLLYLKLNEVTSTANPTDFYGAADDIDYEEAGTGQVGYADHPFPAVSTGIANLINSQPIMALVNGGLIQ